MHRPTIYWLENLKIRDHLGDIGIDGRMMLNCISRKTDCGLNSTASGQSGFCAHADELTDSVIAEGI
jgi:hypothetical protein